MLNPLNFRPNTAPTSPTSRSSGPAPESSATPQESVALSKGPQETFGKPQIQASAATAPQHSPAKFGKTARLVALAVALTAAGGMLPVVARRSAPISWGPL